MKRFLTSLAVGFVVALVVYFGFAIPGYYDLLAHQPRWIVVDDAHKLPVTQHMSDAQKLSLALPKTNSQETYLESTVQNPTSFPPWYPFFIMVPYAVITLFFATLLIWVGQEVLASKNNDIPKP